MVITVIATVFVPSKIVPVQAGHGPKESSAVLLTGGETGASSWRLSCLLLHERRAITMSRTVISYLCSDWFSLGDRWLWEASMIDQARDW